MKWSPLALALLALACSPSSPDATTTAEPTAVEPSPSEQPSAKSPFAPLGFLIGRWEGEEEAVFGRGTGFREYRLVLGGMYLLSDNRADYPVQERLPKGQHHVDWTIFSFDRAAQQFVARQFNGEGFVNHLLLDATSSVPDRLVFVSDHAENAPPGMRVRLTIERTGEDELAETFELAEPDAEFQAYVRSRWRRIAAPQ